jgi:hypothetical protein
LNRKYFHPEIDWDEDLDTTCFVHFKSAEMVTHFLNWVLNTVVFRLNALTDNKEWDPKFGKQSLISVASKDTQDTSPPLVLYFGHGPPASCTPEYRRVAVYIATTNETFVCNDKELIKVSYLPRIIQITASA